MRVTPVAINSGRLFAGAFVGAIGEDPGAIRAATRFSHVARSQEARSRAVADRAHASRMGDGCRGA
jgi:hypothetical protein